MIKKISGILLLFALAISGCSKNTGSSSVTPVSPSSSSGGGRGGSGSGNQAGVITAGEWNDLSNWSFWTSILNTSDFSGMPQYWSMYHTNRFSVQVTTNSTSPAADVPVLLKRDGTVIFTARTDNMGKAELWADLFQSNSSVNLTGLTIDVNNGEAVLNNVKRFNDGINNADIQNGSSANKIEVAFVVDATGSMGDELEYLKTELLDVIARVKGSNPDAQVFTGSVFYRDEGDDYLTRISGFTDDVNTTLSFIKKQSAGGGGDFPEAVHTALSKAVGELQWSSSARTRLIFLVLDAPPHHTTSVITDLQSSAANAAGKGIKIIPVTASGIDKETEYIMRSLAITTNGTYVFITDDSGVGNDHLEATVGQYTVERLNNLMVRLINKYAE